MLLQYTRTDNLAGSMEANSILLIAAAVLILTFRTRIARAIGKQQYYIWEVHISERVIAVSLMSIALVLIVVGFYIS